MSECAEAKLTAKVMPLRIAARACLMIAAGAVATVSSAATTSQELSFSIRGRVKTICHAELAASGQVLIASSQAPANGAVDIGTVSELCNSVQGYSVKLTYSGDLGGKVLKIDSREVTLSPTGETVIYESSDPDVREHSLQLLANVTNLSQYKIGVAITPNGPVY